jgi:hypothetical protein
MGNSSRKRESSSSTWIDTVRGLHVLRQSMSSVILFSMHITIAHFFRRRPDGNAMLVSGRKTTDGSADAPRARHPVSKVRANAKARSAVDRGWHGRICRLALLADAGLQDVDLLISVAVFSHSLLPQWARFKPSRELASAQRAQVGKIKE